MSAPQALVDVAPTTTGGDADDDENVYHLVCPECDGEEPDGVDLAYCGARVGGEAWKVRHVPCDQQCPLCHELSGTVCPRCGRWLP